MRALVSLMAVVAAVGTARAQPAPPATPPSQANPLPPLDKAQVEQIRALCEAQQPGCDPAALFGSFERTELARVLAETHLVIDRAPWGKRLRKIIVEPQDVFAPEDAPFDLLDIFHRTTRRYVIDREVLLRPGDIWKQSAVDETMRKLHDPIQMVVAVAVPVVSDEPGTVDLLIVTRDVWSIRLNSNYEVQSGKLTYLTLSLSENNFFGWRKLVSAVFTMDQGAYEVGPLYIDRNLLGQKLTLIAKAGAIFGREHDEYEGTESDLELSQPLWSLDSHWGVGVTWTHRFDVARSFRGTSLRTYDDPNTAGAEALPWQFREHNFSLTTSGVRQFPGTIEQQVRFGHILADQRPTTFDDSVFPSEAVRQDFIHDVLPRSERSSQLFAAYSVFTPRYRAFHNIETFELAEDSQLGPTATVTAGVAFHQIGSDNNFVSLSTSAGITEPFCDDGLWHVDGSSQHRFDDGGVIDDYASLSGKFVTPSFSIGRVVVAGDLGTRWNETQNRFLSAGGDTGLRGFIIGEFTGQRRAVGHVELRTAPRRIWFTRAGLVFFDDVGGAADTFRSMQVHDDVGIGLRVVVPQTSSLPIRIDWAFAVDGDHRGWPGRIIAGYSQGF